MTCSLHPDLTDPSPCALKIFFRELEILKVPLIMSPTSPHPLLTSPLKGEELYSLPFKGRVGVGMGFVLAYVT